MKGPDQRFPDWKSKCVRFWGYMKLVCCFQRVKDKRKSNLNMAKLLWDFVLLLAAPTFVVPGPEMCL